jgi:hypothetical protein
LETYYPDYSTFPKSGSIAVTVNDKAKTVIVHHPVLDEDRDAVKKAVVNTEGYNFIFLGYWVDDPDQLGDPDREEDESKFV